MSDQKIRDLERARAAGDPEANVRLLHELRRGGSFMVLNDHPTDDGERAMLKDERLALAAYCGHEDSARALGWDHYYVHVNSADRALVKEGAFFESQGGLTEEWGQRWSRVYAPSPEAARSHARIEDWLRGTGSREAQARAAVAAARHIAGLHPAIGVGHGALDRIRSVERYLVERDDASLAVVCSQALGISYYFYHAPHLTLRGQWPEAIACILGDDAYVRSRLNMYDRALRVAVQAALIDWVLEGL